MKYLSKLDCLFIFHRNTTHIIDMPCCYKHQQQKKQNENTKIRTLIHYMYVDIFLPLTKAIPIMFEHVITHYQTLSTWIAHNAMRYHNLNALLYALPYRLPCIFSLFNVDRP